MATENLSAALPTPASSPPYPMAKLGYGKRSVPDQRPPCADDFALLPAREGHIAGFIDRLPEGAAMSVKTLAKQLPLYGQQAVGTALTALSVAGHLRRVRRRVGKNKQVRWVFRAFWTRAAHDNEWWAAYLAAEAGQDIVPAEIQELAAEAAATPPPPPWAPDETPPPKPASEPVRSDAPQPAPPTAVDAPPPPPSPVPAASLQPVRVPAVVPQQRSATPPQTQPTPTPSPAPSSALSPERPSPAYLALAQLGRTEPRLALSAADCTVLEELAADWLARGVTPDYLVRSLVAGLPDEVNSPLGFVRRRLRDKMPPRLPATAAPAAHTPRVMMECTQCGVPGRPEALPDGLCRACRRPASGPDTPPAAMTGHVTTPVAERDVRGLVAELRGMLKSP
ncbi:MarR family transcriptional regulator [Streptomyces sp. NBC_00846]|uniref:MarR family transcriptional regulator n=1 Tax=Streptomyces sp. NBC_00846 TaxID=2975849 RepID=UPI00386BF4BC|nr:MarR family transcriptional regulator [Streptomyces sp. NBC_00846]